ncbi:MAG: glycosyltransferase family 4 protein [Anaerolineaceae bacterium]|nr:glycosyltransferase family 4 protein [Anaerolineaceae bacterium]
MRILIVLTYYEPYKSGLTVYAVRQAEALAARGHRVTVLTSQYDRNLPLEEIREGVRIVRVPVAFRLSKGVVMPKMVSKAKQLIREADVINLHVPQADAAMIARQAIIPYRPVVLTYHCTVEMPRGLLSRLAGWAVGWSSRISADLADIVVHNTEDFAEHSPFLRRYMNKLAVIQPPIVVPPVSEDEIRAFREKHAILSSQPIIGMAARLTAEKGVEYLVGALPQVLTKFPKARVIFVGEYQNVPGEKAYRDRILPKVEQLGVHWTFLGRVSDQELAAFYHTCDVLVLPSVNSTESFGMVQVEAMICGSPAIATDLPGVRQPVRTTGLGRVIPPRDADALAEAILSVLIENRSITVAERAALAAQYSPDRVAAEYEALFNGLLENDD